MGDAHPVRIDYAHTGDEGEKTDHARLARPGRLKALGLQAHSVNGEVQRALVVLPNGRLDVRSLLIDLR